jgi:hypothetical protein
VSTHLPKGTIMPVSSAKGMNSEGAAARAPDAPTSPKPQSLPFIGTQNGGGQRRLIYRRAQMRTGISAWFSYPHVDLLWRSGRKASDTISVSLLLSRSW